MADETVSILKELVQVTRDNNRKAEQDSAILKDGVISQKQLRKLGEETAEMEKKNQEKMKQLVLNSQAQKGNAAGQKKAQEDIKALRTKTEQDSAELKSQTEIMQKAADVRGVSTESFMK